ncbi:MAG TPA: hypothetical protein VMG98_14825, partial [Verrucomicrobiae bacterium]|nr:hypothetical protein [Verrucomicrobiae bacterium]
MLFVTPFILAAALSGDPSQSNVSYRSTSPVHVATCSLDPVLWFQQSGDTSIISASQLATNLDITYADMEQKPISSVTFAVSDGGTAMKHVVDTGTFLPGVEIAHVFNWPYIESGHVTCKVSSVSYSDGSEWK